MRLSGSFMLVVIIVFQLILFKLHLTHLKKKIRIDIMQFSKGLTQRSELLQLNHSPFASSPSM